MKILQVFNRYHEKGGEELSVERVSNVISNHHQVFHCYFDSRMWVGATALQERAFQALRMFYNPQAVKIFRQQLKACNPDIILLHNIFPVGSIGVYLEALKSGIPVCQYIHNFRPYSVNGYLWANDKLETAGIRKNFFPEIFAGSWQNSRVKTAIYACVLWFMHFAGIYRKLDGWVAISEFMRDVFVQAGVPADKIFLLKHSWDLASRDDSPTSTLQAPQVPYFLFLGRITEAKGIKVLLRAWKGVTVAHPDARLIIGGDGPEVEWLIAEIKAHDRVEFRGFLSGEDKARLLMSCRAMVVPSEWWEPLGLVVYEAYQYRRPVIAAKSGGLNETVIDGDTGWLYPPGQVEALTSCMLAALADPEEAKRRGDRGFQWMGENSRNSKWLSDFEEIATVVMSRRGLGKALQPMEHLEKPVSFSIITASFQQIPYLARCAASVADQGGGLVVEHLVHDGKSGDDFDQWAASQTFASCVSEKDGGMYDAINRGFHQAKGEWLAWLNCDEQYLPGTLALVKKWFEDHPTVDILFGDVVLITPEGVPLAYRKAVKPLLGHIRNCFLPTYSAATFVRRKIIDQGFFINTSYRAIADGVWIDSLLSAGFKAGVINQPLAVFTQTGSNLGQSDLAHRENLAWRARLGSFQSSKRHLWSMAHRFRKLIAGAYQTKEVSVKIFASDLKHRRVLSAKVGEQWVTAAKKQGPLHSEHLPAPSHYRPGLRLAVYLADQNPKSGRSLGISRMSEVILDELDRRNDASIMTITSRSSLQPPGNSRAAVRFPWSTRNRIQRILTDHLHPLLSWGWIRADLWYYPKGFLSRLHWYRLPAAVTIHDTIIQYYSDYYPKWRTETEYHYWASQLKHTLRQATVILTVSESSKAQILMFMDRHKIPRKEIHVTYEPCLYEAYPQPVDCPKNHYVLHLGSREPHKRTAWLIRQWAEAGKQRPDLPALHVVGSIPPEADALANDAPNIVRFPFLEDDALRAQFSTALALILPSEIEGFGLPAIEAYYLGTPVCYTRGTSIEEILEVATSLGGFSLDNSDSLFDALDAVMQISPEEIHACGLKLRETYAAKVVVGKMMTVFRECEIRNSK